MTNPAPLSPDILRNRETGAAPAVRPPVAKDSLPAEVASVVSQLSRDAP